MQIDPGPAYNHQLAERVITFLQTGDVSLFPFSTRFDADQRRAFIRDLREGLAELTDSGSARKTSATGFVMRDRRLREIIAEWRAAGGGWPRGSDPRAPVTSLGASGEVDEIPGAPGKPTG
ncbi:MAG: hypothetical protein M3R06_05800 [Chloroflexota bacterium]|nr:hypothetical protein [Chloroflexota bacterium]